MQKKTMTLALAGLLSAPSFAQSSMTIYGIVDLGYRWSDKNIDSDINSRAALDSGVMAQSRIGFKGTEDLGNGLKAGFVLERGLAADTGADMGGWNRQALASLSSDRLGTLIFGRQQTPQWLFASQYDPFGNTTDASMMRTYLYSARLDNLSTYVSPDWGGFSFIAGYTLNGTGDEGMNNDVADARVATFAPMFSSGRFNMALNFDWIKLHSKRGPAGFINDLDGEKIIAYDLFASYDFGAFKLAGAFGKRNASKADFVMAAGLPEYGNAGTFADAGDTTQFMLGVTVPVGPAGKFTTSYTERKTDLVDAAFNSTGEEARIKQYAVGYFHNLSKRTTLYSAYNYIKNNKDARRSQSYSGAGGGRGYQRVFNAGVLHMF